MSSYENLNEWEIIQETDVNLKWTNQNGFPIVKATAQMPFPIDSISKIIEDVKNYPNVFRRVHEVQILDKNIIHVMLDMPFLLSDRDYVIQYSKNKSKATWKFSFNAIDHEGAPATEKYVRLINAFGKWELSPTNENETLLVYTWNGELLGDFPEFALRRAWKTQGNEIIHWIKDALK
tara:strand:+ start:276 stop:809 length:534 start_codon:yes stop_codon:yes gene_type:complete